MARIWLFLFLFCISTTSAIIVLSEQIPYWAGGTSINSPFGNRLLETDQQLSNLGLLSPGNLAGPGLGNLSFGGLQGLNGLQGLSDLQGFGGLQVIQIPLGSAVNSNISPCAPCIICSPQSASINCIPIPKPAPIPLSGQFCCCCTSVTGSTVGTLNRRK
ncbi:hypothetical protein LOAG_03042 [Loa loa]|uniref:Uncharacterized protein n=1 Tax=Loa loa TaxID=7209 RepID=A0A1I7VTE6_LOALO|nr:hypothetical protein LOAG_03042 [Loa loa]EFO25444.1 hypothetical protein LOAG_03042 [Loa loa]